MTLKVIPQSPPIETNSDGVMLVGKTRVTLDTVVAVFDRGAIAEEIVHRYPSLKLADVYGAIAKLAEDIAFYFQTVKFCLYENINIGNNRFICNNRNISCY